MCTDWHEIIRRPSLWSVIDLTSFPAWCSSLQAGHQCTYLCYAGYRHRLKRFLEYLIEIRPVIRTLKFALDIDDPADGYRCLLSELIRVCFRLLSILIYILPLRCGFCTTVDCMQVACVLQPLCLFICAISCTVST